MPLSPWISLLLAVGTACAEQASYLTLPSGGRVDVEPRASRQAPDLVVATAGSLEVSLRQDEAGGIGVVGAQWLAAGGALRAEAVEGDVERAGSLWTVRLRRLSFAAAAGAPAAAVLVFAAPASQDDGRREKDRQRRLDAMSVSEKIGALLMKPLGYDDLATHREDIASGRLGGALLKWDKFTSEQAREFSAELQRLRGASPQRPDVLIAVDHEAGPVFSQRKQATTFPGSMALGAAGDTALTESAARATARELRGQAHLNFGLVADANSNADNPIIGPRSFGEDPRGVAAHVVAALRGYDGTGVVQVVKHFPGHGDTSVDSHTSLPIVRKSLEELEKQELFAFQAAVDAGAQALMTAHILFPALDPDLPATMSKKVIGYLREKMGFQGVLVSDSMDMGAISNKYGAVEASVLAVAAGIDVLLMGKGDHAAIHAGLLKALESGRLSVDRLDEAVARLMRLKESVSGPLPAPPGPDELARHAQLADQIAEKAVTLVRDPQGLVPLRLSAEKRLAVVVAQNGRYDEEVAEFFAQMRRRHPNLATETVAFRPDQAALERALAAVGGADAVVLGTYHWGAAEVKEQTRLIKETAALGKPLVIVSFMSPYDARYVPASASVLSVYGLTPPAARAAARVLFGEIPAQGRSPVTIPGGRPEL